MKGSIIGVVFLLAIICPNGTDGVGFKCKKNFCEACVKVADEEACLKLSLQSGEDSVKFYAELDWDDDEILSHEIDLKRKKVCGPKIKSFKACIRLAKKLHVPHGACVLIEVTGKNMDYAFNVGCVKVTTDGSAEPELIPDPIKTDDDSSSSSEIWGEIPPGGKTRSIVNYEPKVRARRHDMNWRGK